MANRNEASVRQRQKYKKCHGASGGAPVRRPSARPAIGVEMYVELVREYRFEAAHFLPQGSRGVIAVGECIATRSRLMWSSVGRRMKTPGFSPTSRSGPGWCSPS